MLCEHHTKGDASPSLTWEAILNPTFLPKSMEGWQRYRIEYGFECSCPEGIIYLPPWVDPDRIEEILNDPRPEQGEKGVSDPLQYTLDLR